VPFDQTVGQILAFHRNVMSFALLVMNATNACIPCNTGVFVWMFIFEFLTLKIVHLGRFQR
jgi:hypothetical protein